MEDPTHASEMLAVEADEGAVLMGHGGEPASECGGQDGVPSENWIGDWYFMR